MDAADVTIFGPHPLLSVTIERHPDGADEIHLHPAGQGVWVARMAAALGAHPVMCGYLGGETGAILGPLIDALPCERRMVATPADSGSYVYDRRTGERDPIAHALSSPPDRHEIDDLVAATVASALQTRLLVLCNPYPGDALGPEVYERIAADAHAHGVRVLADLSSPRLDGALRGGVDLVKINDWELAEFVTGSVGADDELVAAVGRIREHGVGTVVITRGELPAAVFAGDERWELTAPSFDHGYREGCGDSMMGATAAVMAAGGDWREALTTGAAAGAANFLRRGLGTGHADTIRELASSVQLVRTAG
ncbi:MAG: hypothetical protein JHC84_01310 [Solirubrobacteraceae bacterium]|nr:hypothetical protein [Solirubrobacteraceae bacterium]